MFDHFVYHGCIDVSERRRKMPLIDCPACGNKVSANAPACPGCGEPIKSSTAKASGGAVNPKDPVHLIGLIVVGFMVLGIVMFVLMELSGG
jgi:predicted amidophosphoribosyltransferase